MLSFCKDLLLSMILSIQKIYFEFFNALINLQKERGNVTFWKFQNFLIVTMIISSVLLKIITISSVYFQTTLSKFWVQFFKCIFQVFIYKGSVFQLYCTYMYANKDQSIFIHKVWTKEQFTRHKLINLWNERHNFQPRAI